MKLKITNTTDHLYIGNIIEYDGKCDDLYITKDKKIELLKCIYDGCIITLISSNYIIDGIIIEE